MRLLVAFSAACTTESGRGGSAARAEPAFPTWVDTDGDGYTDRDERYEGHDPADPGDRIYVGGWPYYFYKDALSGGQSTRVLAGGQRFVRFVGRDQFGQNVDLFDFFGADVPVVVDLSAEWCAECVDLSAWLAGGDDARLSALWPDGPAAVARGDVHWVTILADGVDPGRPLDPTDAAEWAAAFPADASPVLADPGHVTSSFAGVTEWPAVYLLDPELMVEPGLADGFADPVLAALAHRSP